MKTTKTSFSPTNPTTYSLKDIIEALEFQIDMIVDEGNNTLAKKLLKSKYKTWREAIEDKLTDDLCQLWVDDIYAIDSDGVEDRIYWEEEVAVGILNLMFNPKYTK